MKISFFLSLVIAACALDSLRSQTTQAYNNLRAYSHTLVDSASLRLVGIKDWFHEKVETIKMLIKFKFGKKPLLNENSAEDNEKRKKAIEEFLRKLQEQMAMMQGKGGDDLGQEDKEDEEEEEESSHAEKPQEQENAKQEL